MQAITVRPHWAWAMLHADKRIENRDFFPGGLVGQRIALHAGRGLTGPTSRARALRDLCFALAKVGHAACPVWYKGQEPTAFWFPKPKAADYDADEFEIARSGPEWKFRRFVGEQINAVDFPTSCVFATAVIFPACCDSLRKQELWGIRGKSQWQLIDFRPLPTPVPYGRGQLGVWALPHEIEEQLHRPITTKEDE